MNLTDLTDVLRDHAEIEDTAHEARMAGIRARIVATRRRAALTGVVCVVLAMVGAVYLALPREVEPAQRPRSLPEYQSGTKLVTQAWGDLPSSSVTIEYTPKTDDFVIFDHCVSESDNLVTMLSINGKDGPSGGCGHNSTFEIGLERYGAAIGEPLVVTMIVGFTETEDGLPRKLADVRPPDDSSTGEFAVGIGERVPINEYSFPRRPETLANIDEFVLSDEEDIDIRPDSVDPNEHRTINVTWTGPLRMIAAMNTPGELSVSVNGMAVYKLESWHYKGTSGYALVGEGDGLDISPGETVRITVIPERATGDWKVQFTEMN